MTTIQLCIVSLDKELHTLNMVIFYVISVSTDDGTAFAIDKSKPTIIPKDSKYQDVIGQRRGISIGDVRRINRMYKCESVFYH